MSRPRRQRRAAKGAGRPHAPAPPPPAHPRAYASTVLAYALRLLPLIAVTALPVAATANHWARVWRSVRPRAWDGTGHYALAQIYGQHIFPDTFGWTHAFFAGMPFPNFYPPLFYWCVALLQHTRLFSFPSSFKLLVALPVLLIPLAVWVLTWSMLNRDRAAATAAGFASGVLLVDYRFVTPYPPGLDYFSTFQIGLYTQPLGFILLIAWFVTYVGAHRGAWRFVLSALLLAATVLANFFNAATAALFIAATLTSDVLRHSQAGGGGWRLIAARAGPPLVALCLAGFWVVPMASQFDYFVTRPNVLPFTGFVTPLLWAWYGLAAAGFVLWARRPTPHLLNYAAACLALIVGVTAIAPYAPRWFPLQSNRFVSTINLLLAVPAGLSLAAAARFAAARLRRSTPAARRVNYRPRAASGGAAQASLLTFFAVALPFAAASLLIKPAIYGLSFFPTEEHERIDRVLRFAQERKDGRYLVEVPHMSYPMAQVDGRAINSYLGAQGNEALSVVFRESSPSSIFFNPLVDAYSATPDSYGFSSVLADDRDFAARPLAQHLERARFVGVRYLVIISPWIKERLDKESTGVRHDLGAWSVYELPGGPPPKARVLPYKPALVVSPTTFKARRQNEYGYVRFAEEQFADAWFDVLLVRAPELQLDSLPDPSPFGALVVDTYEYEDEDRAYDRLREFARGGALVLLSSDSPLYGRVKASASDFGHLTLIDRPREAPGAWLQAEQPTSNYDSSSIRKVWGDLRGALERHKVPVGNAPDVKVEVGQEAIRLGGEFSEGVPLLIQTTFHPNWSRNDGARIFAATPFFMLTFVRQPTLLTYARSRAERAGLLVSALTLVSLCCFLAWRYRREFVELGRRPRVAARGRSPDAAEGTPAHG